MDLPSKVVLATDHAGFKLKESIKAHLAKKGIDVIDVGTFSDESCDYPAIIRKGCGAVLDEGVPGVVFGGSGIGESIAANKVKGIRSARCCTVKDAQMCRKHNNANVMSLGGRMVPAGRARKMVGVFLTTDFEGGRHQRRVDDLETNL
ncbi:MAG: ribose 5-phosphate isomerase B [Candidatus Peribacteraceae bacterium]|jgi:ribose 5-phosphate isomerase B|nr:ribose 5-phosphate isomerase B [Candidatus Peribacteraceae bacterium]|tara:strand:- start:1212 stop:1655 length:444 start_codon:yes stop_codon:yes gene_type:complete